MKKINVTLIKNKLRSKSRQILYDGHAVSPNSVESKNRYFSVPLVSKTIKNLHRNVAFFAKRYATYFFVKLNL